MPPNISRRGLLKGASASALLVACAPRIALQPRGPVEAVLPGNKKIKIIFHFGAHGTAKHAEEVRPIVEKFKPHVFCPEAAFSTEEERRRGEDSYASGKLRTKREYDTALIKVLRDNKIPRLFYLERFEKQESEKTRELVNFAYSEYDLADSLFATGRPYDALNVFDSAIGSFSFVQKARESEVKRVLSKLHENLVKRYPELSREREIRVVVKYGSAHTPLYRAAKKLGFGELQRKMAMPTYFDLDLAALRAETFGLERKNDLDSLARQFISHAYTDILQDMGVNLSNAAAFANQVAKKVNFQMFSRISKAVSLYRPRFLPGRLLNALNKEGLPVPQTKEEVHAFLKRRGIRLAPAD